MSCVDLTDIKNDVKKTQICASENKANIEDLLARIEALESVPPTVITTDSTAEGNCHVNARISSGTSPSFEYNKDGAATGIALSGGSGADGAGLVYTLTFPAHPNGANYSQAFSVYDDDGQPDSGIFEIISKSATQIVYQINQGDDGSSEDDNIAIQHEVKIFGQEQTFVSNVFVNGTAV